MTDGKHHLQLAVADVSREINQFPLPENPSLLFLRPEKFLNRKLSPAADDLSLYFLQHDRARLWDWRASPFIPQVCAAVRKVSLAISSAISIWSKPNRLHRTETIFLYSVLNKCGINSCCPMTNELRRFLQSYVLQQYFLLPAKPDSLLQIRPLHPLNLLLQ